MKKLALTIVCAMAMSGAAFAQGWIAYSLSFVDITMQTNTAISPLFGGTGSGGTAGVTGSATGTGLIYDYALLTSIQTVPGVASTNSRVWTPVWTGNVLNGGGGLGGTNGNTAGRISTVQAAADTQVNWANGVTNNIVLVGWSANIGSSWTAVSNILANLALGNNTPLLTALAANGGGNPFFGETAFGYINPNAAQPGAAIVNTTTTPNGLPIFSLGTQLYMLPVPEPATMALAGLGGLSLLLFRRQRK
jgi:hypothetical protein